MTYDHKQHELDALWDELEAAEDRLKAVKLRYGNGSIEARAQSQEVSRLRKAYQEFNPYV